MKKLILIGFLFLFSTSAFAAVHELNTQAQIDSAIKSNPEMVLEFYDPRCPHCKNMEPIVSEISSALPIYRMTVQQHAGIAQAMHIFSWPTFIYYLNGKEAGGFIGERNKAAFLDAINHPTKRPISQPKSQNNGYVEWLQKVVTILILSAFAEALIIAFLIGKISENRDE